MVDALEDEYGTPSLSLNFVDTPDGDSSLLHGATQVIVKRIRAFILFFSFLIVKFLFGNESPSFSNFRIHSLNLTSNSHFLHRDGPVLSLRLVPIHRRNWYL